MSTLSQNTARLLILTMAFTLCGAPEVLAAQSGASPPSAEQNTPQDQPTPGGMLDPAKGPLQPVPSTSSLPEAPAAQGNAPRPPEQPRQPLGTAVGQEGKTAGGVASTPAGAAIAPAKQRQYRSLLLKVGAIAAAGAAIGAVVALTRSSPATPPGTR